MPSQAPDANSYSFIAFNDFNLAPLSIPSKTPGHVQKPQAQKKAKSEPKPQLKLEMPNGQIHYPGGNYTFFDDKGAKPLMSARINGPGPHIPAPHAPPTHACVKRPGPHIPQPYAPPRKESLHRNAQRDATLRALQGGRGHSMPSGRYPVMRPQPTKKGRAKPPQPIQVPKIPSQQYARATQPARRQQAHPGKGFSFVPEQREVRPQQGTAAVKVQRVPTYEKSGWYEDEKKGCCVVM